MRLLVLGKLGLSILTLARLAAACGGANDEAASEKELEDAARILDQGSPTAPISVTVHATGDTETTEIIDPAGGTVRVTGSGGTRFTLELPRNAVPESTGITLTPVDSLSDLPFNGGLVGAVLLSPDGLVLSAPATLTIESAKPPPAKDQVAFGARSDGAGVHLVPLTPGSDRIQLPILHFSVHGVVKSAPGALVFEDGTIQWEEGYWPTPETPLDRVHQEIGKSFKEQKILDALGYGPGSSTYEEATERAAERIRAARFLYLQDLARRLRAAGDNCQDIEAAGNVITEYYAFQRMSVLLTGTSEAAPAFERLIEEVTAKCARQAWERCRAGEIKGGLDMLKIARQYGVLGLDPPYNDAQWKDLEKCPPIKLVIEDNNDVEFEDSRGKAMVGVPKVTEKSRHLYRGFLYPDKDSLWHGGVDVTIEGTYSTIDEAAAKKRMKELMPDHIDESMSFEEGMKALFGTMKFFASEIPSCKGSYTGKQFFTIEGSFTTGEQGEEQVELAFMPIEGKGPDFYRSTPKCPWMEAQQMDGVKVIPTRLVRGQETAIVIDPPRLGMPVKKYVIPVQAEGIRGETTIIVGGK